MSKTTTLSQNSSPAVFHNEKTITFRSNSVSPQDKMTEELTMKQKLNIDEKHEKLNEFKHKILALEKSLEFKTPIIWSAVISIFVVHVLAVFVFILIFLSVKWQTIFWGISVGGIAGFGVTAGVHRLWCHRSYSATLPLRIILALCYAMAGQIPIYSWVLDHRVHHKYSETDADPHNAKRGFFFAHVGWLMMRKHPEVLKRGKQIDMSDILEDPVVKFHDKYFLPLKLMCCFIIPSLIPALVWGETWSYAFLSQAIIRYVLGLNFTWLVNSAAHIYGNKPYDGRINPTENKVVAFFSMGEGWHNYHHTFPWDYKAAELGAYLLNGTTFWIDVFSKIGWAYDLKQPSEKLVKTIADKHGDGSHPVYGHHNNH